MPRKKIVFVIVEGPSDEEALGVLLSRIYDSQTVHVHIMHCDITADRNVTSGNVVSKIGDIVKNFAGRIFKSADFSQIIHIVDTDGAFIPDDAVIEDILAVKPVYSTTKIATQRKTAIEERNQRKRENLNRLSSSAKIWNIPYHVYYMSCNLDHVLYDKMNSSDIEKENNAFKFARKYRNDLCGFIEYIKESGFSVVLNYSESWQYIRENLRSLERHANLGLCFQSENTEQREL